MERCSCLVWEEKLEQNAILLPRLPAGLASMRCTHSSRTLAANPDLVRSGQTGAMNWGNHGFLEISSTMTIISRSSLHNPNYRRDTLRSFLAFLVSICKCPVIGQYIVIKPLVPLARRLDYAT